MTENKELCCCFTGHRIIPAKKWFTLRTVVAEEMLKLYERGVRTFISGGALGFDTIAALETVALRREHPDVKFVLAIPCVGQDAKWSEPDKSTYQTLVKAADEVICLSDRYYDGCMHARNRFMVDHSAYCISYCTRMSGGSYYTVKYAASKGLERFEVSPDPRLAR